MPPIAAARHAASFHAERCCCAFEMPAALFALLQRQLRCQSSPVLIEAAVLQLSAMSSRITRKASSMAGHGVASQPGQAACIESQ